MRYYEEAKGEWRSCVGLNAYPDVVQLSRAFFITSAISSLWSICDVCASEIQNIYLQLKQSDCPVKLGTYDIQV